MEHKDNNYVVLKQTLQLLRYLQKSIERIDIINYFSLKKKMLLKICLFQQKILFLQSELKTLTTRWKHTVEALNIHLLLQANRNRKYKTHTT